MDYSGFSHRSDLQTLDRKVTAVAFNPDARTLITRNQGWCNPDVDALPTVYKIR